MAKETKQLATNVTIHKDGVAHTFGPGDDLPDWALDHLNGDDGNPDVWATDEDEDDESPKKSSAAKKARQPPRPSRP